MTLADYAVFTAIVECRSLTLAAEQLYLTKSAVSHSVSRMENELKMPLFDRTQKEWRLTEAGMRLLPFAHAILRDDNRFMEIVHEMQSLEFGSVTIGCCSSTCINWIPDILNSFRELYPNIVVRVRGGANNTQIINCIDNNEIDLGIAAGRPTSSLGVMELYTDEMLCVTSKSLSLSRSNSISAEDLKDIPLILQSGDFDEEALSVLQALRIPINPYLTSVDDASLVALVSAGLGYCVVGRLVLKGLSSLPVNVYSFDPPQYRHIGLLYNKRITQSPSVKALKKHIIEYIRAYPSYEL